MGTLVPGSTGDFRAREESFRRGPSTASSAAGDRDVLAADEGTIEALQRSCVEPQGPVLVRPHLGEIDGDGGRARTTQGS